MFFSRDSIIGSSLDLAPSWPYRSFFPERKKTGARLLRSVHLHSLPRSFCICILSSHQVRDRRSDPCHVLLIPEFTFFRPVQPEQRLPEPDRSIRRSASFSFPIHPSPPVEPPVFRSGRWLSRQEPCLLSALPCAQWKCDRRKHSARNGPEPAPDKWPY